MAEQAILATPEEVARLLRISRSRVYQLINEGALPSVRLGGRSVRVPLDALRRWAEEQVVRSGGEPSGSDRLDREL